MPTARSCAPGSKRKASTARRSKPASEATGVALIVVDDASQNAIVIVAGSNGEVTPETIARHEALLAAAEVVICQLETPPDTVRAALAAARRLGKTVILNPAPATGPLPADWLPLIDYLIPNELEAAALTGLPVDTPEDAARSRRRAARGRRAQRAGDARCARRACDACRRGRHAV